MRAGGGDRKSTTAKSGVAKLPHPISDTGKVRDQVGKAVGVSGRVGPSWWRKRSRNDCPGRQPQIRVDAPLSLVSNYGMLIPTGPITFPEFLDFSGICPKTGLNG